MKITYSQEADVLLVSFKDGVPVDAIDIKEGIILHLDRDGTPLELELLDASTFVSMNEFNIQLPQLPPIYSQSIPVHA